MIPDVVLPLMVREPHHERVGTWRRRVAGAVLGRMDGAA